MRQAFISGASSDIGIAVCRLYLTRDYKVVAHYHEGQPGFFDLVERSPNLTALRIDFANPGNLERAMADDPSLFRATDVLVTAQGLLEPVSFAAVTADAIQRAMAVNVVPGILLMRTMVPEMMKRGWGRIVLLSSIGVKYGGGKSTFAYALSKHATEFIPADHKSWAARGVFINALRLGVTDTRIHRRDVGKNIDERVSLIPAGRMATPDEMAEVVYWYGSQENTFTTGQVVTVAGGE